MNRKKLKKLISITLAITSFNFFNSSSIPVLAAIIAKSNLYSTEVNYYNYLYETLKDNTQCDTLNGSVDTFDPTTTANTYKDLSSLFKVEYSKTNEDEHKTILNSISLTGNDANIQLPNDTSLFNEFKLIINSSTNIDFLYVQAGTEPIISYSALLANTNYILDDIHLNLKPSFKIFVKYEGSSDIFSQDFTTTSNSIKTTISNPSTEYTLEGGKLFYTIKWDENNGLGLLNSSTESKKVFYNDNFYDVYSKDANTNLYYSSYYSKIELTEDNIDISSQPEIYTCDKLIQTTSTVLSNDRANFVVNSVIPNGSFQLKDNILSYASSKNFSISTSLVNSSKPDEKITIDPTRLKITSTLQDGQNSALPLSFTLSSNHESFEINNIPSGTNIIRIIYIDENSHLYIQKLLTVLDTSSCSVQAPLQNTYFNTNKNLLNYNFKISDPYLNTNNLNIVKLTANGEPNTSNPSTFYYKIKNSNGDDINLSSSDIINSIDNNGHMNLDFASAIKQIPNLQEGKYSIEYAYYNSVGVSSVPSSSTNLMEHLDFTIDNTSPTVSFNFPSEITNGTLTFSSVNEVINLIDNINNIYSATISETLPSSPTCIFYKVNKNTPDENLILDNNNQATLNSINADISGNYNYVLKVIATDFAGNTNESQFPNKFDSTNCIRFSIDRYLPSIDSTFDNLTEEGTKYYLDGTKKININFIDNNLNLSNLASFSSTKDLNILSKNKVYYKLTNSNNDFSTKIDIVNKALELDLTNADKFPEGTYELTVKVADAGYHQTEKHYNFVIDRTLPSINTTSFDTYPKISDKYYIKNTPNINIKLEDNITTSGLTFIPNLDNMEGSKGKVFYKLSNDNNDISSEVSLNTNPSSLNLNLSDTYTFTNGTYKLDVVLFDFAGNRTDKTYDFVIDKTSPSIESLFKNLDMQYGKYYLKGDTNIDMAFKDDNFDSILTFVSSLDEITNSENKIFYELTDTNGNNTNLTFNNNILSLDLKDSTKFPEGPYTLTVGVSDSAGNVSKSTYKFVIDKNIPKISSKFLDSLPSKDSIFYFNDTANKNIDIKLEDNNPISMLKYISNLDNMEGSKNKVFYKLTNGKNDFSSRVTLNKATSTMNLNISDTNKFPEGTYKLDVTIFDFAGNSTSQTYNFVIDTTSPRIESNFPSELYYFNDTATKNINIKFQDNNLSLTTDDFTSNLDDMYDSKNKVFYNLIKDDKVCTDLVSLNDTNNNLMLNLSDTNKFPEGVYKFNITAFDNAGNRSDKHYTFVIDRTAPVVTALNSGFSNQIETNEKNFFVYTDNLIVTAYKYPSELVLKDSPPNGLSIYPDEGVSSIDDFTIQVMKLNRYDNFDATEARTLTADDPTFIIDNEGFYKIISTYTDLANNISEQNIKYVAIAKEKPKVSLLYLDENNNSINPDNSSYINGARFDYFNRPLTPYIEVTDINSNDKNYLNDIDFSLKASYYIDNIYKEDTYNSTNLIPMKSLTDGQNEYGKYYYYLGKSENDTITRTVLKDARIFSTCNIQDPDNFEQAFSYPNKHIAIEVTPPTIDIKLNNTDTKSSIVFVNNLTAPKFDIQVTGGIAGAKDTSFSIANDLTNISNKFKLSNATENGNTSNYVLIYDGDLKDLNKYNGYYTLTFKYISNTGIEQTLERNFVLDTESPSYVISFNNSDSPLTDGNKQVIDDKLTIDAANSDKLSALKTKKVYSSYKDLYVTIELLDNSFNTTDSNFKDLNEAILSNIKITLDDNELKEINAADKKIHLKHEYFTKDKIYKLKVSSSDRSLNSTERELDIIVDRNAPTITFGFVDEKDKDTIGNKVNDTYYFNKNIKPYINVSDTICKTSELKYSVTINNTLYDKGYTINNLSEKEFRSTMAALSVGAYNIVASVTDFAGNSSTESINLVVDTTNPITELNSLRKNSFVNLNHFVSDLSNTYNYIEEESKLYVIVNNEPYLDVEKFKNSITVYGSNVVCGNNNLSKINSIVVNEFTKNEVTEFMKDKAVDSDETTRVFEISNGNNIFTNGYYKLNYILSDYSGNTTGLKEAQFTIDNTPIDANNTFNPNNIYFNSSYNFSVIIPKHFSGYKSSSIKLYKNNKDVTSNFVTDNLKLQMAGGTIDVSIPLSEEDKSSEGTYSFKFTLTDNTGKEYVTSANFVMDRTVINLSKFNFNLGDGQYKDGIYYTNSQNIDMNFVLDPDVTGEASRSVTINGIQVPSNDNRISNDYFVNDGLYTVIVSLKDRAGNISSYERKIIVDRTAATISLEGFDGVIDSEDNDLYINKIITPKITVEDIFGEDLPKRTSYLNNSVYTSSEISGNGKHTYSVKVFDLAGNQSTKDITFVLDTVKPDITINDVIDGKYYNKDVKPTYSTPDTTATLVAYLNGSPYDGSVITGDGNYALKLVCTDKAKNVTEIVYNFVIDTVAPTISVSGLNENEVNGIITPLIKLDDPLSTILAILNGEYYYGGAISESGKYTLLIKAMDKAGNISEKIISFIIDADVPQIYISNLENGKLYVDEIEPHISVTKNAKISMTLNGDKYDGKNITTPGEYELIVTAVDSLANKSTEVYRFTLVSKDSPEAEGIVNGNDDSNKGTTFIDKVKAVAPTTGILLGLSSIGSMLFMGIKKRIK